MRPNPNVTRRVNMNNRTGDLNGRHGWWRRPGRVALLIVTLLCFVLVANVRSDLPVGELLPMYGSGGSRFAVIEGMRIHYRDEGAGPPLLLIHGTSSSLHTWDGWVQRMRGRRIVRLDLPGFGLTGPAPDADYRAARDARIVASLLDRLRIDRVDVAGNSLGGRVALTLALEYPARVNSLILIDSRGLSGQYPPTIEQLAGLPVIGQALRWVTPRALVRRGIQGVYADPSRVTDRLVDRYYDLIRRDGNRQAMIDASAGPDDPYLDSRLSEIKVPVLLQWGEYDRRIPLSVACRMRDGLRDATLVIYAGAGHVPMEELPDQTSADAESFLGHGLKVSKHADAACSMS
jgi:pimeloyl-ACP methyl ester carboxylesterase